MIVGERKPFEQIWDSVKDLKSVLVLGCGTCVAVCQAGGEKEVGLLASELRIKSQMEGKTLKIGEATIERQCDNIFIEQAAEAIQKADAVLSTACGAGVQAIAERFPEKPVYAGLNTTFIGILEERGVWTEKCAACGACVLHKYGGICPVTRCAKRMLNGPCGGSREDRCEVRPDRPCAWQLIFKRLKDINQLERLKEIEPAKNWNSSLSGGPRMLIREDHKI